MSGTLIYWAKDGSNRFKSLRLTVCSEEDRHSRSLASLRRKRLSRILNEALTQGARLSYSDLCMIMLASKATLKRDVSHLRRLGMEVPLGGRVTGGK
jgi:Fic family protein